MLRKAATQFTPFPWLGVVTLIIFHNVCQVKGVLLINLRCSGTALWPWISYTVLCLWTNGTKKVLCSRNWCIRLICSVAYWELDCQQERFLILNGDQEEEGRIPSPRERLQDGIWHMKSPKPAVCKCMQSYVQEQALGDWTLESPRSLTSEHRVCNCKMK